MPRLRPPREAPEVKERGGAPPSDSSSLAALGTSEPGVTEKEDGSVSVMIADEPVAVREQAPPQDDATSALQKQIAELKKAEQVQREQSEQRAREAAEWQRRATEQQAQMEQLRKAQTEQEEVSIGAAIQAAKAESDKALLDYKNARDAGDTAAEAEAVDRLTDAKSRLRVLESGKQELEERKEKAKTAPPITTAQQQPRTIDEQIAGYPLPQDCKDWLRGHQQYVTDAGKSQELGVANLWARQKGYAPGDPRYLPEVEKGLRRMNSLPRVQDQTEEELGTETEEQNERASIVSAPVSREVPTSTGQRQSNTKIDLTVEERAFAKSIGVSEVDYAKGKIRLHQEKGIGNHGQTRYGNSDRT